MSWTIYRELRTLSFTPLQSSVLKIFQVILLQTCSQGLSPECQAAFIQTVVRRLRHMTKRVWMGGYRCQLAVKISVICQLSVKFSAFRQLSVKWLLMINYETYLNILDANLA